MPKRKEEKDDVRYREARACGTCVHFFFVDPVRYYGNGRCEVVKGEVTPEMVCDRYRSSRDVYFRGGMT